MKNALTVLAECVDIRSGRRFGKGDTFEPVPTVEQATRLAQAGCLPPEAVAEAEKVEAAGGPDSAAVARAQINHDGLFDNTVAELKAIAETEGVDLGDATRKDDIVAAIRAARSKQ